MRYLIILLLCFGLSGCYENQSLKDTEIRQWKQAYEDLKANTPQNYVWNLNYYEIISAKEKYGYFIVEYKRR